MPRRLARALLIVAVASSAFGAVNSGDVLVDWYAWSRAGVKLIDPAGNTKPDVVTFPADPLPDSPLSVGFVLRAIPMRSGDRLIFASWTSPPLVMKYDPSGKNITVYTLPSEAGVAGATSIELFADQCTLAWTIEPALAVDETFTSERRHAIRRFDICANKPAGDVPLVPEPLNIPRFVRQLSNGDLLVVTDTEILRYTVSGRFVASFSNPLPKSIVDVRLTPDGQGFWVGADLQLLRYDLANTRQPAVNVQPFTWDILHQEPPFIVRLSVVDEWRASLQPPPVTKRRAVTH